MGNKSNRNTQIFECENEWDILKKAIVPHLSRSTEWRESHSDPSFDWILHNIIIIQHRDTVSQQPTLNHRCAAGHTGELDLAIFRAAGRKRSIWLRHVQCSGHESGLTRCAVVLHSNAYCTHEKDAGVKCSGDSRLRWRILSTEEECEMVEWFLLGRFIEDTLVSDQLDMHAFKFILQTIFSKS